MRKKKGGEKDTVLFKIAPATGHGSEGTVAN